MLCQNCKNTLTGSEDFCPYCGLPQKITDVSSTAAEKTGEDEPQSESAKVPESSIFQSEPVYIYTDPPKERKDKKSKAAMVLVSLFILAVLGIGVFTLGEYFQLTPAFSELLGNNPEEPKTDPLQTTLTEEFSKTLGVVPPEINFKGTVCTVMSEKGLPLRKGPDNAYAHIETVPYGTLLQVIGKGLHNDVWVYVYIPSFDLYGWVSGSYISVSSELKESDLSEETKDGTTEETPDKPDADTTEKQEKLSSYSATVTAEKGLYLRVGPGTDYEAISVVGNGETVTVLGICDENDAWLYVKVGNEKGYMNKTYLSQKAT